MDIDRAVTALTAVVIHLHDPAQLAEALAGFDRNELWHLKRLGEQVANAAEYAFRERPDA